MRTSALVGWTLAGIGLFLVAAGTETRPDDASLASLLFDVASRPYLYGSPEETVATDVEVFPAATTTGSKPFFHVQPIRAVVSGQVVSGNMATLENPRNHFMILPPLGGCGHRVRTSDTAKAYGCRVAMNAGFFNTATGACLGNLISNGTILLNVSTPNSHFGLRADGNFVTGYLSLKDVQSKDHPILQLVQGVIWLVRKGEVYVHESAEREKPRPEFITLLAPRTAVGHDARGRLVVWQLNGLESADRGLGLVEWATLIRSLGAMNAVNLDGGGSDLFFALDTILNTCSDKCPSEHEDEHCPLTPGRCERAVTSIVCIH